MQVTLITGRHGLDATRGFSIPTPAQYLLIFTGRTPIGYELLPDGDGGRAAGGAAPRHG